MKEENQCKGIFYLSDPWYMIHCQKKIGHLGKHIFSWKDKKVED